MENFQAIFKAINEFVTKENITLALSIFGSLGTLVTFISSCVNKRKNLKIKVDDASYNRDIGKLMITITFENHSRLPIAITSAVLRAGKDEFSPHKYPMCVEEYAHRHGAEVVDRKFLYNLNFPVDIQQLSAASGHILVGISPKEFEILSTPLIFEVHSTRGRAQRIELPRNLIKCF